MNKLILIVFLLALAAGGVFVTFSPEIGDHRAEGNALWNMSLALEKLGERARAVECAEGALEIREQIEDPWRRRCAATTRRMAGGLAREPEAGSHRAAL